jgi:hypothetical protein
LLGERVRLKAGSISAKAASHPASRGQVGRHSTGLRFSSKPNAQASPIESARVLEVN